MFMSYAVEAISSMPSPASPSLAASSSSMSIFALATNSSESMNQKIAMLSQCKRTVAMARR